MSRGVVDEVLRLIDRDEAYDEDPLGQPPIRVFFYRDALRAALVASAARPNAGRWLTSGEYEAYRAGADETLAAVRLAIAEALGPALRLG